MDNLTPITREEILMNDEPLTPITREEKILAGEDLTPVTRREYFLKKYRHAGGDVMVEELSVTENGTYTAPEGKAYSPVNVNVPMPENAYLLKTASGSLVSFNDGTDLPMPSFVCNIDAVQDLHGYDAPWVGGAGKNKLPMTVDSIKAVNTIGTWSGNAYTRNGVTFTLLTDNDGNVTSIKANGTSTSDNEFSLTTYRTNNYKGYIINGSTGGSSATYNLLITYSNNGTSWANEGYAPNGDATIRSDYDYVKFGVLIRNGVTVTNKVFYPMIRLSTETSSAFAPYENICPISGHTGVDAWVRGKNLLPLTVDGIKAYNGGSNTWTNNSKEINGVTYTILTDSDGNVTGINADGTASAQSLLYYTNIIDNSFKGAKLNGYNGQTGNNVCCQLVGYYNASGAWKSEGYQTQGNDYIISDNYAKLYVGFLVRQGKTVDNVILYPMIRPSTDTDATYEPYNPQSQTIQVSWQTEAGEVYGGYVDLVSGELTVTHKGVDMGSLEYVYQPSNTRFYADADGMKLGDARTIPLMCSCYIPIDDGRPASQLPDGSIFGAGTSEANDRLYIKDSRYTDETTLQTALTGQTVVYPLETPITYQLTPTQIKSLLGNNNAWCDTGDVTLEYFGKGAE